MNRNLIKIIIFLFIAMGNSEAFASSDIGFIIRKSEFSLMVRFGFAEAEQVPKEDAKEITGAGGLLYDCVEWIYRNEKHLKNVKADIVVWWDLPGKRFNVQAENDMKAMDITYKRGSASKSLLHMLSKILKIPKQGPVDSGSIPLYLVMSKEYIDDQYHKTDIFFGAIPGYTYSESKKAYVALLWSLDGRSRWIKRLRKKGATIEQVRINRKRIQGLLGYID